MKNRPKAIPSAKAELLEKRQLLSNALELSTPVSYAVGEVPSSVAVADFNGDGKADLAVANFGGGTTTYEFSNSISILDGEGNGSTFQPGYTIAAGNEPYDLITTDLNGDGKADLVVADYGSAQVEVLLGNGNGTFVKERYSVGTNPTEVVAGDINGDGKTDLVVADFGSPTVSVLLGNGNGTFQQQYTVNVGGNPHDIALADLTGDGKLDLVASEPNSDQVEVFLSNGNGTFGASRSIPIGSVQIPESLAVGDFTGDGILDLAVAFNYDSGNIQIFWGNGNGTFFDGPTLGVAGNDPSCIQAVDMNNDGYPDLVATTFNSEKNLTEVFLNNGNGTFAPSVNSNVGTSPSFVDAADLNGDGQPDLAITDLGSDAVTVLLNIPQFAQVNDGALDVTGSTFNDTISVTESNNVISTALNGVTGTQFSTSQVSSIYVLGVAGNDSITVGDGVPGGVIIGGGGNDTIDGGQGNVTVVGGPGSDSLTAGNGADELKGGKGPDTLVAGNGLDTLVGNNGFDSLVGGTGASFLIGGPGGDTINGAAAGAQADMNTILGGMGNDSILYISGDSVDGGGQSDTIIL